MKEYFITFCIAFFMTVFASSFNVFRSLPVAALGGIPLAAVAYWRMVFVDKTGLSLTRHTVAFMLGWFLIFAGVIFPFLESALGGLIVYCSWGIAALSACLVYMLKGRRIVVAVISLAVWISFVLFVIPAWEECLSAWPKGSGGNWILPWSKV